MKIKCRECKTIYDDNEKYCPYCFTRTKEIVRYRTSLDNNRLEGSVMKKREATKFNYQKRATTKFKNKKKSSMIILIPFIAFFLFFILTMIITIISNLFWYL